MIGTPALHQLVVLAERQGWRLALIGDHRQLQAVGRGGLFHELCANGRVEELEQFHRFTQPWEAAASLLLRAGDPRGLDAYEAHGRIIAGTLEEHLGRMATAWIDGHQHGRDDGVGRLEQRSRRCHQPAVQTARLAAGHLDPDRCSDRWRGTGPPGDVVATRRNDRRLITTAGEPVRNRETWTVTAIHTDGDLTVTQDRDTARSACRPSTCMNMCGSAMPPPNTATSPPPSPPASSSPRRRRPGAASTWAPPAAATRT